MTIADNVFAEEVQGGGIYFSHNGNFIVNNEPTIINSIIYNNYPYNFDENFQDMGPEPETYNFPSFLHSDVEGSLLEHWENLGGNIESDPLFINSNNGNFNLSSNSPCIDAGTADINGDGQSDITDYLGSAPDMGAFEYIPNQQNGDLNGDGSVNIIDIVALVNIILNDLDPEGADYNGDGTVNVIDVVALVQFVLNN